MKLINLFAALALCCVTLPSIAQNGNSPYSRFVLGELTDRGGLYNIGMGGIGIASSSQAYANIVNPALMARNKLTFFEAAFWAESKNLITNTDLQATQTGNLGGLTFGFPIARKVTIGGGLTPYSIVNYNNRSEELLPNSPAFIEYTYIGSGGMNQAYLSAGWNLVKDLYVGARVNYNFGFLKNQSQSFVNDGLSSYKTQLLDQTNINDFSFKLGSVYRMPVGKDKSLNFGVTYDVGATLSTRNFQARQRLSRFDVLISTDTLSRPQDRIGTLYVPPKYGFGLSFERPFHYLIGIDFTTQDWRDYKGVRAVSLANTFQISAGGEWTPNTNSIDNYLARITYRAGINYSQLPSLVSGIQLDEKSVSLGFSMPFMRGISSANIALILGQRGTTEKNLVQENFFRFNLGLTINDQWFVRRKIN